MLISTSAVTLDYTSLTSFLVKGKSFEVFVERPEGQPFWWFSTRRDSGSLEMWGFGAQIIFCRPYSAPLKTV
ncbi:hypothetical protein [Polaromonas sp. UC242_47]|uniref:hypothetical protein n=1 Tax=Polaromonas sp. UC242_47 TaxID=3374626 RepID=UPI00379F81EE